MDNNFVWTDELVAEFLNEGEKLPHGWAKEIKRFKESKQLKPLEWEVHFNLKVTADKQELLINGVPVSYILKP